MVTAHIGGLIFLAIMFAILGASIYALICQEIIYKREEQKKIGIEEDRKFERLICALEKR